MVCFSGARSSTLAETLLGIETDEIVTAIFDLGASPGLGSTLAETFLGIETPRA